MREIGVPAPWWRANAPPYFWPAHVLCKWPQIFSFQLFLLFHFFLFFLLYNNSLLEKFQILKKLIIFLKTVREFEKMFRDIICFTNFQKCSCIQKLFAYMTKCLCIQNKYSRMDENVYEFKKCQDCIKYSSFWKTIHEYATMFECLKNVQDLKKKMFANS